MRAPHDRTDNAVDGGLDTIDRQCQSAREVVAGTDGHDTERLARATDRVDAKSHHAITADRDQIIVFVATKTGIRQGFVKARAGHIDHVEAMPAPGLAQQVEDLPAYPRALAFVRCRIADHGDSRIRM